ncbi:hypothetical protein L611_000500000550 [Aminobacter sp. J15]|nr:hypothetical protein L610_002500000560 [Aminobacter sp. J44]TWH27225.1 hypothetical protein L611_000500000550 [Aminobacter sp. J15]
MKVLTLVAATLGFALSSASAAEPVKRPKGVVELFTSQGCNSCPPADEYLSQLALEGDVVALSYHVDYWDYLGWRDTLANADNTQRQQQYNRAFGTRSVYTPQAIVNGRQEVNGAKRDKVDGAINRMAGTNEGMIVDVSVSYSGDSLVIETGEAENWKGDAHVVLVYFDRATQVKIERGKNTGRSFTYLNSVNGFHSAGKWHGKATRLELPMSEISRKAAGGCAVLLQSMKEGGLPGPVIGAAIVQRQESW